MGIDLQIRNQKAEVSGAELKNKLYKKRKLKYANNDIKPNEHCQRIRRNEAYYKRLFGASFKLANPFNYDSSLW